MNNIRVGLRPIATNLNLPTVLKTAILPGEENESLIIATQIGEIFSVRNSVIESFLNIRPEILELGTFSGGYDERGLLGLAFNPGFTYNGLFYLHYSVAGTQGPGALSGSFLPDPCNLETLHLTWENRETQYDHIDTVEEWIFRPNGRSMKQRTLLNLRRPFSNHNGINSLNFSPESEKLVLTTGDGGSGYDPFNLSQNDIEIPGKIIEIDIAQNVIVDNSPAVTQFDELPEPIQETLTVIAKGGRNLTGISYERLHNRYRKYVGNVGQELVEAIYSFINYKPIPVTEIVRASFMESELDQEEYINLGWRGWEGNLPTTILRNCSENSFLDEKVIAFYDEMIKTSVQRLLPLTCYYHEDPRPDKFEGNSLTAVQPYMGKSIPGLTGCLVFTDWARTEDSDSPSRGVLAYTKAESECKPNDFHIIEIEYDFDSKDAYYVSLGTNLDQTRLYLGVHSSMNVADFNQGMVFEVIPIHNESSN